MKSHKLALIAGLFLICASPALAIDFDATVKNLDGTPILDEKGQPVKLTVRMACINALMSPLKQDEQAKPDSGTEKTKRNELALHVLNAPGASDESKPSKTPLDEKRQPDHYVFTSEDIALMKRLVNDQYPSPLLVAQVWKELEKK